MTQVGRLIHPSIPPAPVAPAMIRPIVAEEVAAEFRRRRSRFWRWVGAVMFIVIVAAGAAALASMVSDRVPPIPTFDLTPSPPQFQETP